MTSISEFTCYTFKTFHIPKLSQSDKKRLFHLDNRLKKHVIGQDQVMQEIVSTNNYSLQSSSLRSKSILILLYYIFILSTTITPFINPIVNVESN